MVLLKMKEIIGRRMTKGQLMDYYGFDSADIALPQAWLNEFATKLYESPEWDGTHEEAYDFVRFNTVWMYGEEGILGGPVFLSVEAKEKIGGLL